MFKRTPLPYRYDALEPVLSEQALQYHHDKHHRAYVDKLNELIADQQVEAESLDDLLLHARGEIYTNVGQFWNHDFYWAGLCAKAKQPAARLSAALAAQFGSMSDMKQQFNDAGLALFGSGWVWLVVAERYAQLKLQRRHLRRRHARSACTAWLRTAAVMMVLRLDARRSAVSARLDWRALRHARNAAHLHSATTRKPPSM